MSLINCKECNKQISSKATTCPNCGVVYKNQSIQPIKWAIFAMLIFAGLLLLLNIFAV